MSSFENRSILLYEFVGIIFIIILGSLLHFTFEWSGYQPLVGIFSAANESVWEHLKLGFWPTLLYAIIEYRSLRKYANNFFWGKAAGIYIIPAVIIITFYSYTVLLEENLLVDILTFIIAVIIGQLASYKLLTYRKLPEKLNKISLVALAVLSLAFIIFTFYPPSLPIFQDPTSGEYGIINHSH
jgi:hypothetical protein